MSRVGLVSTFRFVPFLTSGGGREMTDTFERCWSTLESFLLFHLSKGVEHVFLYADDDRGSNDVYIEKVAETFNKSQVSVDVRSESQRERQQANCRLWSQLGSFSATELFFTSEPCIQPHFDRLNQLGVEQMTYANHEAVPLREHVGDYFREVSTFKVNHLLLPLTHEVGERARFWRRRTSHGQYMLAYDNGKSAVRVLPGRVVPQSVHRWRTLTSAERENALDTPAPAAGGEATDAVFPSAQEEGRDGVGSTGTDAGQQSAAGVCGGGVGNDNRSSGGGPQGGSDQLVNRVAMADPRELRFDEVLDCCDPCVLHYPSCGLDWLRDKYRLLGCFPSSWFDGKLPIAPCFHLDARNAMHGGGGAQISRKGGGAMGEGVDVGAEAGGDGGRALYRNEVMLCPDEHSEEMQAQLQHGVLRVIDGPASVIQQALDARASPGSEVTPEVLSIAAERARLGSQEQGPSASGDRSGTQVEDAANRNPTDSSSMAMMTALRVAGAMLPETVAAPTAAVAEGDAKPAEGPGGDVDNAWILAACAREFL
eukprot:g9174.t2